MSKNSSLQTNTKKSIEIIGARMHNLKNVSLSIPRNKLIVLTGLSGSGKSSLAFDTLYAEGQRRYVESLSSYARQFMGKLDKPDVESIKGISPAVAIEQKVISRNPRSTVGTTTEIYDYLKLLFARIGKTYSPISGELVKSDSVSDIVSSLENNDTNVRFVITCPWITKAGRTIEEEKNVLLQKGFTRVFEKGVFIDIESLDMNKYTSTCLPEILIDRLITSLDSDFKARVADSVQTAYFEGNGTCHVHVFLDGSLKSKTFSDRFEADKIRFEKPSTHFFSFNNPMGACRTCEGFGSILGIDPDLVIPNKKLSVYEDAVVCWKGEKMSEWKQQLVFHADKFDFPIHRPYNQLSEGQKVLLWTGNRYFEGLTSFFKYLEENSYKIQYRVMLSRYRGRTTCPDCKGTRLRKDANYVKVNQKCISDLVLTPVDKLHEWFTDLPNKLNEYDNKVAKRILIEITNRLQFLNEVGLSYLTLNRLSNTLSGGESQRINLATSLGSSLVGSLYILDEPSIGLHPRDTLRLVKVLEALKNLGNTVIVVEHEEEIMRAADQIIDLGPFAGSHGGEIVFQGTHSELHLAHNSLTADYLLGTKQIEVPLKRREWKKSILIEGANENNLKNVDVEFPLEVLTVITGVSGSGKSSLVRKILYPALTKHLGESTNEHTGKYDLIGGNLNAVAKVEFIDQNPIGKSSRSNPVTYIKAFDDIRTLFSNLSLAIKRRYKPAYFSFNVEGGRCENCKGDGTITVEMQFMADVHLKCEECNGNRFKEEVLEVVYRDKNIFDILELTVDDAIAFFKTDEHIACKRIVEKLLPLQNVGLGYLKLGQSNSTLSGGEAQRIKLASFLTKGNTSDKTLFIFDEPTTGLHFHDIEKLLSAFTALIGNGHSIIVVEHNLEIIKSADWIIDLGPDGGENGGAIVCFGTPEHVASSNAGFTSHFLKEKLEQDLLFAQK